ncbi:MAG TPA: hypothetical protein VIX81_08235, partial [Gammaproteobacteria bacterium]
VVVERTIGGIAARYLERLDFNVLVDCAVTGGVASSASGLDHLEGATVALVLDGSAQPTQLVSGGSVTFARASDVSYQVGLPWPDVKAEEDRYQATLGMESAYADGQTQLWIKLLPTPVPAGNGPTHGRRRRTPEVLLQLWGTSECRCNGNMVVFRRFGTSLLDQPTPLFTGFKRVGGVLGWSRDDGVEITQTQHLPFLLLSVTTYQSTD